MLKRCAILCQWLPASFVSLGQNPGSNKLRAEFWRSDARASSARAKAWATSPGQGAALLWVGQLVCFMVHWFLVKKYAGPESWSLCLGCNPHTVSFSSPDFWGLKLFFFFMQSCVSDEDAWRLIWNCQAPSVMKGEPGEGRGGLSDLQMYVGSLRRWAGSHSMQRRNGILSDARAVPYPVSPTHQVRWEPEAIGPGV